MNFTNIHLTDSEEDTVCTEHYVVVISLNYYRRSTSVMDSVHYMRITERQVAPIISVSHNASTHFYNTIHKGYAGLKNEPSNVLTSAQCFFFCCMKFLQSVFISNNFYEKIGPNGR